MKFKVKEIEVPADNPFANDALEHQALVLFLAKLIGQLEGPFVLALDAPWGCGKTTLVRMLQAVLSREKAIPVAAPQSLPPGNFQCVYFNAWKVDYATDPLVALVSALDDIRVKGGKSFSTSLSRLKDITGSLVKRAAAPAASFIVTKSVSAATGGLTDLEDIKSIAPKFILNALNPETLGEATGKLAGNVVDAFLKEKKHRKNSAKPLKKRLKNSKRLINQKP